MKKTQRTTLILSVIYLILLTWIILLKTQFSFADLGALPFHQPHSLRGLCGNQRSHQPR